MSNNAKIDAILDRWNPIIEADPSAMLPASDELEEAGFPALARLARTCYNLRMVSLHENPDFTMAMYHDLAAPEGDDDAPQTTRMDGLDPYLRHGAASAVGEARQGVA